MANLLDALRTQNAGDAIASLYDSIEFRSAFSPPVVLSTKDLFTPKAPGSAPPWWLSWLKPTVIVRGAVGEQVIAPAGVAGNGTVPLLLAVGSIVALGFVLGRWTK